MSDVVNESENEPAEPREFPETAEAAEMLKLFSSQKSGRVPTPPALPKPVVTDLAEAREAGRVLRRFATPPSTVALPPTVVAFPTTTVETNVAPTYERIEDIRQTLRIGDHPRHAGADGETVREFFRRLVGKQLKIED